MSSIDSPSRSFITFGSRPLPMPTKSVLKSSSSDIITLLSMALVCLHGVHFNIYARHVDIKRALLKLMFPHLMYSQYSVFSSSILLLDTSICFFRDKFAPLSMVPRYLYSSTTSIFYFLSSIYITFFFFYTFYILSIDGCYLHTISPSTTIAAVLSFAIFSYMLLFLNQFIINLTSSHTFLSSPMVTAKSSTNAVTPNYLFSISLRKVSIKAINSIGDIVDPCGNPI